MSTTKADLKRWFKEGRADGNKWMIVVCDTFSYDDYPVYVKKDAEFDAVYRKYVSGENMQRIMESYDLSKDMNTQMTSKLTHEYPVASAFNPKKPSSPMERWLK